MSPYRLERLFFWNEEDGGTVSSQSKGSEIPAEFIYPFFSKLSVLKNVSGLTEFIRKSALCFGAEIDLHEFP